MHLSIFCTPGVGGGIHGAVDRRPFLAGGNLTNLWNPSRLKGGDLDNNGCF